MHERPEDVTALQALLDRSAAAAGTHLSSIFTPERRVGAEDLCARLTGMCLLTLATVTATGEPRAAPVDGLFYRGRFWFGSSPESVRFRHIAARPAVSLTHLPGESFCVIVHGRATVADLTQPDLAGFRACCLEVYGPGWEEWGPPALYARVDADRMFTFTMPQEEIDAHYEAGKVAAAVEPGDGR